ncbi:glycosyl transferase family 2 [Marinosulfonomonas sp. PRT-SC04]|nr:glycosyl transferase family 2 [Marinosulfonomonas sp. PRT-SC04]
MHDLWTAYRMRLKRRRLLYRALRKRRQLTLVSDRTHQISTDAILVFSTVRNEICRLPYFLEYYRNQGAQHFLFVDNNSDDGTRDYLAAQPDVSLWETGYSYKLSRFGMDWVTWLQIKYGHDHWCLTVDADEILIYPHCETRPLRQLTDWLDQSGTRSFGAMMLDMYPKGALNAQTYQLGQDPFGILRWFDAGNYRSQMQQDLQNLWMQGGVRDRVFFAEKPERAPSLNKTPLVKWSRRYTYVSSTHSLLPRYLNQVFDPVGTAEPSGKTTGVLLHSKFLHMVVEKSAEEKRRQEHFANSNLYDRYYDSLAQSPNLWCVASKEYSGWQQLEALGLLSSGAWR